MKNKLIPIFSIITVLAMFSIQKIDERQMVSIILLVLIMILSLGSIIYLSKSSHDD